MLNELEKDLAKANFKAQRLKVDKGIVTNILQKNLTELEQKNKIIAEQIEFREQLLANVNHELRTPLNAIIGMGKLLQKTILTDTQKEYTGLIERSAENLLIIINDFLTLSTLKAKKLQLSSKVFSIQDIFNDLYNVFSIKTQSKNIELRISTAINLPNQLIGDPTRLHQIIQNLLHNAIKFTEEGFVSIQALLKKSEEDIQEIEFVIEDSGIGIPKEKQDAIFQPFTQAHTNAKRDYMGTGLGLNIVKNLVDLMQGSIHLKSEEKLGTKIVLNIPFQKVLESSPQLNHNEKASIELVPEQWQKLNFLMIEDNPANILYAKELFKSWHLKLSICETYMKGLQVAMQDRFDLIFCDLKLPDGNGINLIKEVRNTPDTPNQNTNFIILTASILQADKDQAQALNVLYLEKPYVPDTLFKVMASILAKIEPNKNNVIVPTQATDQDEQQKTTQAFNKQSIQVASIKMATNNPETKQTYTPSTTQVMEQSNYTQNIPQSSKDVLLEELIVIKQLEKISKESEVQLEFINILLEQFEVEVPQIKQGIANHNYKIIQHCSHKIKSTLKIFNFKEMAKQVMFLEQKSKNQDSMDEIKTINDSFMTNVVSKTILLKKIKTKLSR